MVSEPCSSSCPCLPLDLAAPLPAIFSPPYLAVVRHSFVHENPRLLLAIFLKRAAPICPWCWSPLCCPPQNSDRSCFPSVLPPSFFSPFPSSQPSGCFFLTMFFIYSISIRLFIMVWIFSFSWATLSLDGISLGAAPAAPTLIAALIFPFVFFHIAATSTAAAQGTISAVHWTSQTCSSKFKAEIKCMLCSIFSLLSISWKIKNLSSGFFFNLLSKI